MNVKLAFRLMGLLCMLVTMIAPVACDGTRSQERAITTAAAQTPVAPSTNTQEPDVYVASGPIVVENDLDVAALRDGVVVQILADTGKKVRKGDILARLDDRQLVADHEAAQAKQRAIDADVKNWEAEVKVLEADLSRTRKMWDAQLITKEQLDHAEFKVVADRYELERERQNYVNQQNIIHSLELEAEKTRIATPFDGVVARRYVRLGQRVASGDRLFWVTATAPLRVRFTLPERYAGTIRNGDSIEVAAIDSPDVRHAAKVIQISPVVDPSSGAIEVLAEVVAPAADLRPGMTVHIHIENLR